jgi:hydroxymethylpyrimidine/phosphomethylpyrimidine kinase
VVEVPTLWLLAGADPGGGAGLWRDQATARACAPELQQAAIVTAWTRQGAGSPATTQPRISEHLRADLAAQPAPAAIKVGLLPESQLELLPLLAATGAPLVLDPVLRASDGGQLGARPDVLAAAIRDVFRDMSPGTWLITPNRGEAAALAGVADDDPDLLARISEALGGAAVLLKDGHGGDSERVRDRLANKGVVHTLGRKRQPGPDPRGTGCALATAIACGLARGRTLLQAVAAGVAWLDAVRGWTHPGPDGRPHLPDAGPPLPA